MGNCIPISNYYLWDFYITRNPLGSLAILGSFLGNLLSFKINLVSPVSMSGKKTPTLKASLLFLHDRIVKFYFLHRSIAKIWKINLVCGARDGMGSIWVKVKNSWLVRVQKPSGLEVEIYFAIKIKAELPSLVKWRSLPPYIAFHKQIEADVIFPFPWIFLSLQD